MQQINLIDLSLRPQRQLLSVPVMLGLAVVASVALLGHYVHESSSMSRMLAAIAVVGAAPNAQAGAADPAAPAATQDADAAALRARIATLEALRSVAQSQGRLPKAIGPTLDAIIASLADSAWLTEIDVGTNGAVRISGGTLDARALAGLADRLSRIAALKGTPIGVLRIEPWPQEPSAEPDPTQAAAMPPAHRFVIASVGHSGTQESP